MPIVSVDAIINVVITSADNPVSGGGVRGTALGAVVTYVGLGVGPVAM